MPRQDGPATPEELAERITKLPAWAKRHIEEQAATIEAREELIRVLGGQVASLQEQSASDLNLAREISGARDRLTETRDTNRTYNQFPDGFYVYWEGHSMAGDAMVLVVESHDGPMTVKPVAPNEIIIARG